MPKNYECKYKQTKMEDQMLQVIAEIKSGGSFRGVAKIF